MFKSIILSALMVFTMGTALAQGGPPQGRGQRQSPEEMAKSRADMFQEEFGLSDDQHKKVYDLILTSSKETREKIMALREEGGSRDEMREVMLANAKSNEEALKKIFNDKQWEAYQKWREENPMNQRRRRGGGE